MARNQTPPIVRDPAGPTTPPVAPPIAPPPLAKQKRPYLVRGDGKRIRTSWAHAIIIAERLDKAKTKGGKDYKGIVRVEGVE